MPRAEFGLYRLAIVYIRGSLPLKLLINTINMENKKPIKVLIVGENNADLYLANLLALSRHNLLNPPIAIIDYKPEPLSLLDVFNERVEAFSGKEFYLPPFKLKEETHFEYLPSIINKFIPIKSNRKLLRRINRLHRRNQARYSAD